MKNYEKIPFNEINNIESYVEEKLKAGHIIIQIIANESLKQIDDLISYAKSYYRSLPDSDKQLKECVITKHIDPYYAFKNGTNKFYNDIDINEKNQSVIDFSTFKADFIKMEEYYDGGIIPYYGKAHYEFYVSIKKCDIENFGGCMEVEFITEWMIEHGYYNMSKNKEGETEAMEKMSEITISDVKGFTEGKKVKVQMSSAMSLQMVEAIVIADPDSGNDGKIAILMPDTGCKIELDSEELIDTIYGNENEITINFFNNMGSMDISIIGDVGTEADNIINQDELCQHIKDRLDRLSKLTVEDIDLVLNMEMEYLQSKGIVD